MTTRLLLVRHGQIDANIESRWHGSTDGELTQQGREEARRVAAHLARTRPDVAAVYTSPLKRARDTATLIAEALGAPMEVAAGLAEYSIGVLENETFADLAGRHRFFEQAEADIAWSPPGGESISAVATRVVATWRDVARRHPAREVALVSHGAAIATGLATLLDGDPRRWPSYRLRNTSVTEIVLEPSPKLLAFDLIDHLD
jgi:2,3-bisphosphoglycerate-dependent phosphoglycerate mutase